MTAPRIIGLAGRAGSGKSTAARLLCEYHAFVEVALGDPSTRALASLLNRRRAIADDLWLIMARRHIDQLTAQAARLHIAGIVISDLRYPDEADMVRQLGGTVWHIVRAAPPVAAHCSEAGITPQPGDRTLDNTGTLDQLETSIEHLLYGPFALYGDAS